MNRFLSVVALTFAVGLTSALSEESQTPGAKAQPGVKPMALSDQEHRELQALLEARIVREREYREALLAVQAAQARFDAAGSAAEAAFFKICAKQKVDPDLYELTADGKALSLKTATPKAKKPE